MLRLTKTEIGHLKITLERLKEELKEQVSQSESSTGIVTLDQTLIGRLSRIDAMQQQNMAISNRQSKTFRLRKIQIALEAIRMENYGYCDKCDNAIGYARLNVQPEANLCINCQDEADQ